MRLQLVLREDWQGNTRCLVAQDLALLIKVRTLIHEEISLLTVLYFPFRARTLFPSATAGLKILVVDIIVRLGISNWEGTNFHGGGIPQKEVCGGGSRG